MSFVFGLGKFALPPKTSVYCCLRQMEIGRLAVTEYLIYRPRSVTCGQGRLAWVGSVYVVYILMRAAILLGVHVVFGLEILQM